MSMIPLALHDALNNQKRHGATVVVTLHAAEISGRLKEPPGGGMYADQETVLIETREGGWRTVKVSAIEAVGARP